MFIARYKLFPKIQNLLSPRKNSRILITEIASKDPLSMRNNFLGRNNFSTNKHKMNENKGSVDKLPQKQYTSSEDFLWKLNIFYNVVGFAGGLFFPQQALYFILMSNGMLQVYESSKSIDRIKKITQKSQNYSFTQVEYSVVQIKEHLKAIGINKALTLGLSILTGLGIIYPSFGDYSLLGLNFWILYNLKFNNLSQGYYFALLSLLLFQYTYFTKVSKKQNLSTSN